MAVDPVTLKLLLQAAVNVATDEESRRKVLAIVIGVVMFVIFFIVLPIYLLTSPLDALQLVFSGDELPQIELFRNENMNNIVIVEPNIVFEGEYPLPVKNAVITSGYGQRIDPITFEESFHLGIDFAGEWRSNITAVADIPVKRLIGIFNLRSFVAFDMRNYAGAKFIIIDYGCVDDKDDFILALQSLQMMTEARIIVILSGCDGAETVTSSLIGIGVINIVTGDKVDIVTDELTECLSPDGMQRYVVKPSILETADNSDIYQWNANNIKVAAIGAQHRCGVTVTLLNMAAWLASHGAKVAYVEANGSGHMKWLLPFHGNSNTVNGIDILDSEPDGDYNFILYDCGAVDKFNKADRILLFASLLPYDMPALDKVMLMCKSYVPILISSHISKQYFELVEHEYRNILHYEYGVNPFDANANSVLAKQLFASYILTF